MNKRDQGKEIKDIFCNSFSLGLLAMGIYNVNWFVRYLMNGRDISIIPPKMQLYQTDIYIIVAVTVFVMIYGLLKSTRQGGGHSDSSGTDRK